MSMTTRQRARLSRGIQYAVLVVVLIALVVLADWDVLLQRVLNPAVAMDQFPGIITVALKNTLIYTVLGFVLGLSLGVVLALMKLSSVAPYRWIATLYIEFFRGVPALLVFLALGYGIPLAFGFRFNHYVTVMIALGVVAAAYIAESLRAGLQAVPRGQWNAASALGMRRGQQLRLVVLPQALRVIIPPMLR